MDPLTASLGLSAAGGVAGGLMNYAKGQDEETLRKQQAIAALYNKRLPENRQIAAPIQKGPSALEAVAVPAVQGGMKTLQDQLETDRKEGRSAFG